MDFERSIIIRVREQAQRALTRINNALRTTEQRTERAQRASDLAQRATQRWQRAVQALGRAYDRVRQRIARFGDFAVRIARRATQALAATGLAVAGGVFTVSASTTEDAARASTLGLEVNDLRRLREFLARASDGLISRDESIDVLRDIIERQQEARQEIERGEDPLTSSNTAVEALRNLGLIDQVNASSAEFVGSFLEAFRNEENAAFLGRELASDVGDALSVIANLSQERIREIERDVSSSVARIEAEDVENARAFNGALSDLRASLRSLIEGVVQPLIPSFTSAIDGLANSVQSFIASGGAEEISSSISTVADEIFNAIRSLVDNVTPLVDAIEGVADRVAGVIERIAPTGRTITENGQATEQTTATDLVRLIRTRETELQENDERLNNLNAFGRFTGVDDELNRESRALEAEIENLRSQLRQMGQDNQQSANAQAQLTTSALEAAAALRSITPAANTANANTNRAVIPINTGPEPSVF